MNVLLLCSNPVLGLPVVRCLGEAGHAVVAIGVGRRPCYRYSRHCRDYVAVQARQLQTPDGKLIRTIKQFVAQHKVDIVVPADLPATLAVNELAPSLRTLMFPTSPSPIVNLLHDKWTFSGFLCAHEIPHPRTCLVSDGQKIQIRTPWMIKPRDSDGGRDVSCVDSLERLQQIISRRHREWIVQEFIPGHDIDISFLADDGKLLAWTIQTAEGRKRMFQTQPRVLELAQKIAAASQYNGVAHIDMRIDERDGSVQVIEFNPRFWNTLAHSHWLGVNFPDLGLRLAHGEKLPAFTQPVGTTSGFSVNIPRLVHAMLTRRPPSKLGPEAAGLWRQIGSDPLPEIARHFARKWAPKPERRQDAAGRLESPVPWPTGSLKPNPIAIPGTISSKTSGPSGMA